jgi:hypothetical protein
LSYTRRSESTSERTGNPRRPALVSLAGGTIDLVESPRTCSRCGREKAASEFTWKDAGRRKRQAYCRNCMNAAWREWYNVERNKLHHRALVARRRRQRITRHQELIAELKRQPCADCGQRFPQYVMDFDHVGRKTGEVSKFVYTHSTQRLMAEITNCDVVCANCHRVRTQERLASSRRNWIGEEETDRQDYNH